LLTSDRAFPQAIRSRRRQAKGPAKAAQVAKALIDPAFERAKPVGTKLDRD
jgi:hypothetical protein